MNKIRHIITASVAVFALLFPTGCKTANKTAEGFEAIEHVVGSLLKIIVPPDFEGDLFLSSDFTGLGFDLNFLGLHWTDDADPRLSWDGLTWNRDGFWTNGDIKLTPRQRTTSQMGTSPVFPTLRMVETADGNVLVPITEPRE